MTTTDDTGGGDFLAAGTRLKQFEIERVLGAGGFGVTYLAHDTSALKRLVAIKEYLPPWGRREPGGGVGPRLAAQVKDYEWGLKRFLEEAQVLAGLHHAHIVQVYQVFESRGTAYMVTEYVKGRSLESALRAEGPWPVDRVLDLLDGLIAGLAEVHGKGLVHRDVKPANVMLREDESPVLIDFGAARQAVGGRSGSLQPVLTPGYAPIEQYSKKGRQGPWTDVYALGALAYEALSGHAPDEATERALDDSLQPIAEAASQAVSARLSSAVMSALAFRRENRPQSVREWRALLLPVDSEAGKPEQPEPRPLWLRLWQWLWLWLARAAVLVAVMPPTVAGLVWWFGNESAPENKRTVARVPVGENAGEAGHGAGSGPEVDVSGRVDVIAVPGAEAGSGADPSPATNETGSALENPTSEDLTQDGNSYSRLVFRDCAGCPEMVEIPEGEFKMGSPTSEEGRWDDEGPQHQVILRSFALGVTEVTFDEWEACVRGDGCDGYRPRDRGWGRGSRPVIYVSWVDAQAYVSWLSKSTGAQYRLPSESEWEYAARAGTTTPFHTGATISTDQANYIGVGSMTYREWTMPVRTFAQNAFGLYDVHGNVWEWVEDCLHDSYRGAPSDGTAWTVGGDCGHRVLRGGSWDSNSPWYIRSAFRGRNAASDRNSLTGFRVAMTLD